MYDEVVIILKMLLTSGLVSILGLERQMSHKPVSVRTVVLVGSATTLFTSIALILNASFVISGIITGIGFLGGGVIVTASDKKEVRNLTTASMVWIVAAIGICVGINLFYVAIAATITSFVVLRSKKFYQSDKSYLSDRAEYHKTAESF
jgi:putative Mg2+ transporter-C (MgtC) family protein